MKGNEHCVRDCEKQGPCEACGSFKADNNDKCSVMGTDYCKSECPLCRIGPVIEDDHRINVDELNRKFKRPKYHPSSVPR